MPIVASVSNHKCSHTCLDKMRIHISVHGSHNVLSKLNRLCVRRWLPWKLPQPVPKNRKSKKKKQVI